MENRGAKTAQDFGNPHAGLYFIFWQSRQPRVPPKTKREKWTYPAM